MLSNVCDGNLEHLVSNVFVKSTYQVACRSDVAVESFRLGEVIHVSKINLSKLLLTGISLNRKKYCSSKNVIIVFKKLNQWFLTM